MSRLKTIILTLLIIAAGSSSFAQSVVDPIGDLKACARIGDRDLRVACLESLGERVLQQEKVVNTEMPRETAQPRDAITATGAKSAADDLMVPAVGNVQESSNIEYNGSITSCKQGHFGNWFFILDNGQVWKEVKKRNRRFEECNFNVTILRDAFGFKMRIDKLDKSIRVRRQD